MFELTGKLMPNVYFAWNGKPLITIEFNEKQSALEMMDELQKAEKLSIKVKKFKQKRSLDANAYAWVLIGKIAEKTNVRTDEVYRSAIKNVGGNSDVVCIKNEAVETLCRGWTRNGLGWQTDTFPSKIEGCTNVILYYGSSCYDTSQMNRLLNILLQDCEALGIETRSREDIESLLDSWRG